MDTARALSERDRFRGRARRVVSRADEAPDSGAARSRCRPGRDSDRDDAGAPASAQLRRK